MINNKTYQRPMGPKSKELIQPIEFAADHLISLIETSTDFPNSESCKQAILKVHEAVLWARQGISDTQIGR